LRTVRFSKTASDQLDHLLDQGRQSYSDSFLEGQGLRVVETLRTHLIHFPASHRRDRDLGLHLCPIRKTPFIIAYDFDDDELRVHFVLHRNADRSLIDPGRVFW
jgi:mRNA-degrading endonuclease RelE of RelBE toxin-antitoxin system